MKVLVGVIVYNRTDTIDKWLRAWNVAEKYGDAELVVIHNHDDDVPPEAQRQNILKWQPDHYWPRGNRGQDIGALRDLLKTDRYGQWDVLFWAVDDNIPMRKDFLRAFITPFETDPTMGLVGNYWVRGEFYPDFYMPVADHFRTSSFAISRAAADSLYFPQLIRSKLDCYDFEWRHPTMNMTAQLARAGFNMRPVSNDWDEVWVDSNEYVWDIGCLRLGSRDPRCRKDYTQRYNALFAVA